MDKFLNIAFLLFAIIIIKEARSDLSLAKVARKVNIQNRKLNNLIKDLASLQEEQGKMQGALGQIKTAMQGMGAAMETLKDMPVCEKHPDFRYVQSLGSCYHLEDLSVMLNATNAEALCQSKSPDSHLVAIETEEEQEFLENTWSTEHGKSSISRYWTVASLRNGQWVWTYQKQMEYENWIASTSHDNSYFPCMAVYSSENYWWIDVACWAEHAVTCEINV